MSSWSDVTRSAPDLAAAVRDRFEATGLGLLATLRADGSPRITGLEPLFALDELWLGMMPESRKALDLLRDPRFALHSGSDDPPGWSGDAKLAGVAEEVRDLELIERHNGEAAEGGRSHLFRLDLHEVSTVGLDDARTALVIELWTPEAGVRTITRA
jgi:hypothetical protein